MEPKLSLELGQEKPPKRKGLWQRVKEVAERLTRQEGEEGRRDPSDW